MIFEFICEWLIKIIAGYLLADFMMGIFHWIKDTYFSPFTPIIGKHFIWGSRLHHIRPRHILEFRDWDLFCDSAKWTLLWVVPLSYFIGPSIFIASLFLTISANDVIHKYAHMVDEERPQWATLMQKLYLCQSYGEHRLHHIYPHEINYCPMSPFLNITMERIDFWRRLEDIIENYLGVKPREKEYDFVEDINYPGGIKFLP
jgi:hypothetical protein